MAYSIRFLPTAAREFRKVAGEPRKRIAERIDALAHDPRPPGARMLEATAGYLRIRVGDYRVIYQIDDDQRVLEILIVKIGHRRDVYRYLKR